MDPGKGGDDKDNPLHFSGEIKDWLTFKEAIQSHADACDTTWLLEAGRALASFFATNSFSPLFHPLQHPAQTAILCPTKFVCLLQVPSTPRVGFLQ